MSSSKDTLLLDDVDRRLLGLLRKDARTPIARLSKSVGISRASVYARLQKMQDSGVIEGFTVRLSPDLERRQIRAHVLIKVKGKLARSIEKQLHSMPEMLHLLWAR